MEISPVDNDPFDEWVAPPNKCKDLVDLAGKITFYTTLIITAGALFSAASPKKRSRMIHLHPNGAAPQYEPAPVEVPSTLEAPAHVPEQEIPVRRQRPYEEQPLTPQHKEDIEFIITSLGTKSYYQLWQIQADMEIRGDRVKPAHPLKFLETIFSCSQLSKHMKTISQSYFIWGQFKDGVISTLEREDRLDNVEPHTEPFAEKIGARVHELRPLIQERLWERLVLLLIENAAAAREEQSP